MVPVQAGPRSLRMSPNRLLATTTSKRCGCSTKRAVRMSMWCFSTAICGYCRAMRSARPSHQGMLIAMPLLLVATSSFWRGRAAACSKANFSTRSAPKALITVSCTTISRSVPAYITPPRLVYSPSVFSRTTRKSISPGFRPARGQGTPSNRRTGRRLMYWSNSRRNLSRLPHSEMWSGTVAGQPTAPNRMACCGSSCAFQSGGIISPCWA